MDSNRIKKLAEGARTSLMIEVSASLDRVLQPESDERIASPSQVAEIERSVEEHGRDHVVEQVAYTWFNRLCALRFMDVKGYTSTPCVSPHPGESMPAILADARRGMFDQGLVASGVAKARVQGLLNGSIASSNPLGEAFVTLLLSACDAFAKPMGYLFGGSLGTKAALALLAPSDLLSDGSVLQRICDGMDEDDCENVEVLGWLYQYYIAERKDEIFHSNGKREAKDIAPATQLFTPNWIVRYMVENSLGRLWMLNFPDTRVRERMDYYIEPEDPEKDFIKVYSPEEITFCDPACGSGHILVYAFDLLFEMYLEEGYRAADIPSLILGKNLSGFEIDARAAEIAAFALEMKAREKDVDFFEKDVDARITVFEPVRFDGDELSAAGLLVGQRDLLEAFDHLDEVGSLYRPEPSDEVLLKNAIANLREGKGLFASATLGKLEKMEKTIDTLSQRFDVVVANPPYMGSRNMNAWLTSWLKKNYPDATSDLCTCFIKRGLSFVAKCGYCSMITMQSFMFESSYELFRKHLLENYTICNFLHLGIKAFKDIGNDVVQTCAFVLYEKKVDGRSLFIKLDNVKNYYKKQEAFFNITNRFRVVEKDILSVPGVPITAYWADESVFSAWSKSKRIEDFGRYTGSQNVTGNNEQYVRIHWEVSRSAIAKDYWVPYAKGGEFRRYYGNILHVVDWREEARNYYATNPSSNLLDKSYWYKDGITYSAVTSRGTGFRYLPEGCVFDKGGATISVEKNLLAVLGFLNTKLAQMLFLVLNPSVNLQVRDIKAVPIRLTSDSTVEIQLKKILDYAKHDWDSREISIDFRRNEFVGCKTGIEKLIKRVREGQENSHEQVMSLMKMVDSEYCRIYGISVDILPDYEDRDIPIVRSSLQECVKSIVSYAVGCMFGRYSLDEDGLILANQGDTLKDYLARIPDPTFMPDEDNILPVLDEEWFEDDIVGRFKEWLKAAYSPETYAENLAFVEDALGMDIRTYFTKKAGGFYDDHCQTYSVTGSGKRPIYWMFSSPNNSFNALIYMHRYDEGTVGKILTDYVREMRHRLDAQIAVLMASQSAKDQSQAYKYQAMADELDAWEREVLYPLAQSHVHIDLDDGVKVNYNKFPHALRKVSGLSKW